MNLAESMGHAPKMQQFENWNTRNTSDPKTV